MSTTAPSVCRVGACQALVVLVERAGEEEWSDLRQQLQDKLPHLLTSLFDCAAKEEGDMVVKVK